MLERITKRIARRQGSALVRFATQHPKRVAGMAGVASAFALGATAFALFGRRRNGVPDPALLSVDGPREPTRAELYNEARRRDIHGRSGMSKEELKEALSAS